MQINERVRKIAVLDIDGESFEVDGHFDGQDNKVSWYTVTRTKDQSVQLDHLSQFPSCDKIRNQLH